MKEFKILILLVILTGITYFGIEPMAHKIMHPHVSAPDFEYKDLTVKAEGGNAANGQNVAMACLGCHSIKSQGLETGLDDAAAAAANGGVVPPDLSHAGKIYSAHFLASFVMNPNHAAFESTHKIAKEIIMEEEIALEADASKHAEIKANTAASIEAYNAKTKMSMPPMVYTESDAADVVAYLQSIAKDVELTNKEVFTDACGRCHTIEYDKAGHAVLEGVALAKDNLAKEERKASLTQYLGSTPPDLSQMIRSRGEQYLINFISDPQKYLTGTAMPRVGVTKEAAEQVVAYLESIGDSKKAERDALGLWVIGYMVLFTILAYFWKRRIWSEVK